LLDALPASHLVYLRHVICVLHEISVNARINNMTARNLSVCVAQNLLWPPRRSGASEMLTDVSKVSQICHRLIESAAEVFGPGCLELFGRPATEQTVNVNTDEDEASDNVGTSFCVWTRCPEEQSLTSRTKISGLGLEHPRPWPQAALALT